MTEETPSGEETATAEVSEARRKCTMQPVLTVVPRLRYLSGPTLTDLFIAETAFLTTGNPEKTVINFEFIRKFHLIHYIRSGSLNRPNGSLLFSSFYCYFYIQSLNSVVF
jgi:hypothetical protein